MLTSHQLIWGLLQTQNCSSSCVRVRTRYSNIAKSLWHYYLLATRKARKRWWRIVCQKRKAKCVFGHFQWRWTKSMWKTYGICWRQQFRYVFSVQLAYQYEGHYEMVKVQALDQSNIKIFTFRYRRYNEKIIRGWALKNYTEMRIQWYYTNMANDCIQVKQWGNNLF